MLDFFKTLPEEKLAQISLIICPTLLIIFMAFIIYDLAKKAQAGRYGTLILFTVLGLGIIGFVFKTFLAEIL